MITELSTILSMFEVGASCAESVPPWAMLNRELVVVPQMQTRNNGISLHLNVDPYMNSNFFVSADPTRLNQILVNLISNSCRILESFDGPRRCTIEAHAFAEPPSLSLFHEGTATALAKLASAPRIPDDAPVGTELYLLFLVRDTGPGISAETQSILFTKFNRLQDKSTAMDATRSAVGGGAGLGLYLAKK